MPTQTVKILNQTKGTTLADRAEVADAPFKRLKGLLGKNELKEGEGLIITPCNSIHTFFMRFSIDVAFLDRNSQIVALAESLPPARLFASLLEGKLVIELPSGTLSRTKTTLKDKISIEK